MINYDTTGHILWPYDRRENYSPLHEAGQCPHCKSWNVFFTKDDHQVCRNCWRKYEMWTPPEEPVIYKYLVVD